MIMDEKVKKKTSEYINILEAYRHGETIQVCHCNVWTDIKEEEKICWNFGVVPYRIKPKAQYRPYENIAEITADMIKHSGYVRDQDGDIRFINKVTNGSAHALRCDIVQINGLGTTGKTYKELVSEFVWADDNSCCGVKIE